MHAYEFLAIRYAAFAPDADSTGALSVYERLSGDRRHPVVRR